MDRRLSWLDLGARPAVFPALCFGLGVWCVAEHGARSWIFLTLACGLGLLSLLLSRRTGAHVGLLLAFGLGGAGLSTLAARTEVPPELREGGPATIDARIEAVARIEESVRLDVAVSHLKLPGEATAAPAHFRARLYARGRVPRLYAGQTLRAQVRLKPLEPPLNPGQADFHDRLARRGTLFSGSFDPESVVATSPPPPSQRWLEGTHQALTARVRELAPSPEAASLYLTLAAGLRAELGEELEARFSESGLAHVLSVSGLHVAVLAVVLVRLLRALLVRVWSGARRLDVRRVAAPLAVPLVWAYVVFTGSQAPAVRSAVMATAVLAGMAVWRRADALNALALAALALLAFEPAFVADLSTQLSFLAVASLVLVAPAIRAEVPVAPPDPGVAGVWRYQALRAREAVLSTLCASVAVTLASAPLVAYAFQRLSLAGLISNVICLPLCAALTVTAAGGAGAFVVAPVLADPFIYAGAWGCELMLAAVRLFARVPGASLPVASFGAWGAALFLVGVFGWALARGRARFVGLLAPAGLIVAFAVPRLAPAPPLSVTFLSVGHGDAIVVSSGGRHALIDGGGNPSGADVGRKYVLPFLREARIDGLDLAVLSHPHPDHALGLITALETLPTKRLWVPPGDLGGELGLRVLAAAGGAAVEEVQAGREPLRLGEAVLEVLGPPTDSLLLEGVNDRSVVLRLRHGEVTFLLTGDVEAAGEELLDPGPVTVMKVPHHGSRTSSSEEFVQRTRPRIAVFCVGRNNRFRFPDEGVQARYEAVGARCLRTDRHGAVRIDSDGREVTVSTFLTPSEQPGVEVADAALRPHRFADDP